MRRQAQVKGHKLLGHPQGITLAPTHLWGISVVILDMWGKKHGWVNRSTRASRCATHSPHSGYAGQMLRKPAQLSNMRAPQKYRSWPFGSQVVAILHPMLRVVKGNHLSFGFHAFLVPLSCFFIGFRHAFSPSSLNCVFNKCLKNARKSNKNWAEVLFANMSNP